MADLIKKILQNNESWAEDLKQSHPELLEQLAKGQTPKILWIGCSDSRVAANTVTGTMPGEIFVHRNIANVVVHTDSNLLSVVFYAVTVLKIEHIILCGHYGCGGVQAAMTNQSFGFIDNWLTHLKDVYTHHKEELDAISDETQRFERFVERNVQDQVVNLAKISFIQQEWKSRKNLQIHGFVYDIATARLKDLGLGIQSINDIEKIYHKT